jgi:methyl-accepting chemotaxis protein
MYQPSSEPPLQGPQPNFQALAGHLAGLRQELLRFENLPSTANHQNFQRLNNDLQVIISGVDQVVATAHELQDGVGGVHDSVQELQDSVKELQDTVQEVHEFVEDVQGEVSGIQDGFGEVSENTEKIKGLTSNVHKPRLVMQDYRQLYNALAPHTATLRYPAGVNPGDIRPRTKAELATISGK